MGKCIRLFFWIPCPQSCIACILQRADKICIFACFKPSGRFITIANISRHLHRTGQLQNCSELSAAWVALAQLIKWTLKKKVKITFTLCCSGSLAKFRAEAVSIKSSSLLFWECSLALSGRTDLDLSTGPAFLLFPFQPPPPQTKQLSATS